MKDEKWYSPNTHFISGLCENVFSLWCTWKFSNTKVRWLYNFGDNVDGWLEGNSWGTGHTDRRLLITQGQSKKPWIGKVVTVLESWWGFGTCV